MTDEKKDQEQINHYSRELTKTEKLVSETVHKFVGMNGSGFGIYNSATEKLVLVVGMSIIRSAFAMCLREGLIKGYEVLRVIRVDDPVILEGMKSEVVVGVNALISFEKPSLLLTPKAQEDKFEVRSFNTVFEIT